MGDENPSLEIPMKNWSLKIPWLLLTGATPIKKKTETTIHFLKNKTSNPKNPNNKNKKHKNNTFQTNQTNPKNIAKNKDSKQMSKHKKLK